MVLIYFPVLNIDFEFLAFVSVDSLEKKILTEKVLGQKMLKNFGIRLRIK